MSDCVVEVSEKIWWKVIIGLLPFYQELAFLVDTDKIKLQENMLIATVIEPARLLLYVVSLNEKLIIGGLLFLNLMVMCGSVYV